MKKKILISGGSGFLGKNLTKYLMNDERYDVSSFSSSELNLLNYESFNNLKTIKFDKIFHLAAWTQAGDFSLYNSGMQWINNQLINSNILRWWHSEQPQAKLLSIGTSCSYDEKSSLKEEEYLIGSPIESLYTYGMCKRMLHIGKMSLSKQFGLKYLTTVPSTLYGPNYELSEKIPHFIFDLIKKIILGKKYNKEVELWGDGYQRRELVYVDDYIKQLLLLDENLENDICNIGAGEDHSIRDFAKLICKYVDYNFDLIKFNKDKYTGAKSKKLNTDKIKSLLPNYNKIKLNDGLEKTINFISNNL
jgi:GDP-L-fucose synthase|tara:strand:+ start:731 stop:1645 length:915 start_codon:yes stop_codon:yes gene_type:complete